MFSLGRIMASCAAAGAVVAVAMTPRERGLFAKIFFIVLIGFGLLTAGMYGINVAGNYFSALQQTRNSEAFAKCTQDPSCRQARSDAKMKELRAARDATMEKIRDMRNSRGSAAANQKVQGYWVAYLPNQNTISDAFHFNGKTVLKTKGDFASQIVYEFGVRQNGNDIEVLLEDGKSYLLKPVRRRQDALAMHNYHSEKQLKGAHQYNLVRVNAQDYERMRREPWKKYVPDFAQRASKPEKYLDYMKKYSF